jgi:hypothetical protein
MGKGPGSGSSPEDKTAALAGKNPAGAAVSHPGRRPLGNTFGTSDELHVNYNTLDYTILRSFCQDIS